MGKASLEVDVDERAGRMVLRMRGTIDEDAALGDVAANLSHKTIVIDTAKIVRLNSCGVRDWVRWVKALEARGNRLYLVRCSPAVVVSLNMFNNFCAGALVVSVLSPHACTTCNETHFETVAIGGTGTMPSPPQARCGTCGSPAEFDDDPKRYFAFARLHVTRTLEPGFDV